MGSHSRQSGAGWRWLTAALLAPLMVLAISPSAIAEEVDVADFGPGRYAADLVAGAKKLDVGDVDVWNDQNTLYISVTPTGWTIKDVKVYVGDEMVFVNKAGQPVLGKFPYGVGKLRAGEGYTLTLDMREDLGVKWGTPHLNTQIKNISIRASLQNDRTRRVETAWAEGAHMFTGTAKVKSKAVGQWFAYKLQKPGKANFVDSPVAGLGYSTWTFDSDTDDSGAFLFYPGEQVEFSLGRYSIGSHTIPDGPKSKVTPLDLVGTDEIGDTRVINMARLLQSLDTDGSPKAGISISPTTIACLEQAAENPENEAILVGAIDFEATSGIDELIDDTLACAIDKQPDMQEVDPATALENLEKSLDSTMFRKNVSKTPDMTSTKSKLNIMARWFPALRANGEPTTVEYRDETGALIRTAEEAKPIVVTYTDAVEETGAEDIFAGISRDDGTTFKRMNLSRAADKSSFELADGTDFFGQAKKPVIGVQDNNILVAWTSKYCNGGRPAYAIDFDPDTDDYIYDNEYYTEDIWGVAGPQRSVDYTDQGFPEVGEVPYSCVWTARGVIATQADVEAGLGEFVGDSVWFKPERLTSGRRDANQVFLGSADGAGFAIAWQEDPEGLRPGQAKGPGPGWGGATTNHKTDIWYSYITWDDFQLVDANFVAGGDPQHDDPELVGRPKALVPMSLPVRVTDNDVVNSENIMAETTDFVTWTPTSKDVEGDGDGDGTHAYGYMVDGLCTAWYKKVNEQDETKQVCVTADGRLLDGNTGASRPNLFLQKYTKADGTVSAWAIFAYDESKGLGAGPPEEPGIPNEGEAPYLPEEGKNSLYHSFDFMNPDLVSAGAMINLPQKEYTVTTDDAEHVTEVDVTSNISYVVDEDGNRILEPQPVLDADGVPTGEVADQPQINYENARRPRFIIQGKKAATDSVNNTIMMILYKEGEEGSGRPSDIMLRPVVVPDGQTGNPYRPENIVCNAWETADNGQTVCVDGAQNMSTVNPTITADSQGEPTSEDPYGAVKVVEWEQTENTLAWPSGVNRYEDARAHRGAIMGDFVVMGYSYTPNWAAYRNGNDKYDFFLRRSFDGGLTWTTDPNGVGVTNCDTFTDPVSKEKTEVCVTYGAGEFEQARNLSQLPNSKESVIEPRIVKAPGTIKNPDDTSTGYPEDINRFGMYYVSYGTATNPGQIVGHPDEPVEIEEAAPLDLFYSFSQDLGETHVDVEWNVNPDSEGNYAGETVTRWDYLAKGDPEQGEAQLRMTPDGSRLYATWLEDDENGSDIWFRRIMSPEFPANVSGTE
ncbi:MAG: choice-of-anchor O protein [Actinomycetota bacterium]